MPLGEPGTDVEGGAGIVIARAFSSLVDPAAFFRWLGGQRPRLGAAFCVLLLQVVLSEGLALLALRGDAAASRAWADLLRQSQVPTLGWVLGWLAGAPLGALLAWAIVWGIVRLGAGSAPRLWEVAAWSQLPRLVLAVLRGVLLPLAELGSRGGTLLSLFAAAWSAWFVYTGVRELSRGRALPAALVYACTAGAAVLLPLLLSAEEHATANGSLVL